MLKTVRIHGASFRFVLFLHFFFFCRRSLDTEFLLPFFLFLQILFFFLAQDTKQSCKREIHWHMRRTPCMGLPRQNALLLSFSGAALCVFLCGETKDVKRNYTLFSVHEKYCAVKRILHCTVEDTAKCVYLDQFLSAVVCFEKKKKKKKNFTCFLLSGHTKVAIVLNNSPLPVILQAQETLRLSREINFFSNKVCEKVCFTHDVQSACTEGFIFLVF